MMSDLLMPRASESLQSIESRDNAKRTEFIAPSGDLVLSGRAIVVVVVVVFLVVGGMPSICKQNNTNAEHGNKNFKKECQTIGAESIHDMAGKQRAAWKQGEGFV